MEELIVINQTLSECRLAHIKDDVVQQILVEQSNTYSRVGDIHWGKVVRVVQVLGAFLDIGDQTPAFLPNAAPVLGAYLMVQITKDAYAQKPVTLSTSIRLVSAYVVYLPTKNKGAITISTKIKDDTQKNTLTALIKDTCQAFGVTGGVIARTSAKDNEDKVGDSLIKLHQTWQQLVNSKKSPRLLLAEPCLPLRFVRDFTGTPPKIVVDDKAIYALLQTADMPVSYHAGGSIFAHYGAETALDAALARRISLPSGGYLTVELAETLTLIDVNAGVAHSATTNSEAVPAIAHLLKLCNIGGVVAVDFVSTKNSDERQQLLLDIERLLGGKGVQIHYNTKLDLLHLVGRRKRQSLQDQLCTPCPVCLGAGYTKSVSTYFYELVRALIAHKRRHPTTDNICVKAHADVIAILEERRCDVEVLLDCTLIWQVNVSYRLGQWAIS